jgi:Family of unknown function (DUF6459)
MLPSSPPPIRAHFTHYEAQERDASRSRRRPAMASPVMTAGRIAVALFEVEAGARPGHQLERLCHPTLWERLALRLCYGGGPAITCHSLRRVVGQEHIPGLVDAVAVLRRGDRVEAVAMRLDAAAGRWEVVELQYRPVTNSAFPLPDPLRVDGARPNSLVLADATCPASLRSPARRLLPA